MWGLCILKCLKEELVWATDKRIPVNILLYHYTINNGYTLYNICNVGFLDFRICDPICKNLT